MISNLLKKARKLTSKGLKDELKYPQIRNSSPSATSCKASGGKLEIVHAVRFLCTLKHWHISHDF